MTTTCAPCIFGGFSSLVSYPVSVALVSEVIQATVSIGNDSIPTTSFVTQTIAPTTTVNAPAGIPVTTITYTDVNQLTFTVPGVPGITLTYPTTYADYTSFQGAAVTGAGCASTLVPTGLAIPSSVPQASLIYPLDRTGQLPSGLVSYLDGQPAFLSQLNGDQLSQCGPIAGAVPPTGGASSVTLTLTSTLPTTSTGTTTIPPPSTFTSTGSVTTVLTEATAATAPVTQTSATLVTTISLPNTVVISGTHTTQVTAQSIVVGSSTMSSINLSSVLSALSSKSSAARVSSSGVYTNITSTVTSTYRSTLSVPASRTSSVSLASYTGVATPTAMSNLWWNLAALFGFVFYL